MLFGGSFRLFPGRIGLGSSLERGAGMGKIVLYISTSLDGYIADTSGGVDWLGGEEAGYQGDYGFGGFFETVGAVLMGGTDLPAGTT